MQEEDDFGLFYEQQSQSDLLLTVNEIRDAIGHHAEPQYFQDVQFVHARKRSFKEMFEEMAGPHNEQDLNIQPHPDVQDLPLAAQVHVQFLCFGVFLATTYYQLSAEVRERLDKYIWPQLSRAGEDLLLPVAEGSIQLERLHFGRAVRRDGMLKLVLSVALKCIYKSFCSAKNINQTFNPRTYIKRDEINRRIFEFYFQRPSQIVDSKGAVVGVVEEGFKIRDGQKAEHQQIFDVQKGVTEEFIRWSLGLKSHKGKRKWINHLLSLMAGNATKMVDLYTEKSQSMISRIWDQDSQPVDHDANDILEEGMLVPRKSKTPKNPLTIFEFREAVAFTRGRISELANELWLEYH